MMIFVLCSEQLQFGVVESDGGRTRAITLLDWVTATVYGETGCGTGVSGKILCAVI